MVLIFSTIWTELYIQPPEFEQIPVGILYQYGLQIKYAFIVSLICFILVIILNKKRFKTFTMFLAILGLIGLLGPFLLFYLFKIFTLLK
ncbi:hypothetical protein GCM10007111_42480 [Virgibacillus kapii]|uniref:DUF3810 domain-containing protein n=1 Tax=Virgibacillus kapii TaxID=1638645 RepID=A0ABQ2DWT6_9BACI|nr:hypothetical protein GCM10007111_42480 [Virgibacillus kapii]